VKLADVIAELVKERGLDKNVLSEIVCEGMLAAYEKKYPGAVLQVKEDASSGELLVLIQKKVVSAVEDDLFEITLKKAKTIDSNVALNDEIWLPFEEKVGRIEVLRARQVIAKKIKNIEAMLVYNQFVGKQGHIVVGVIHKTERNGISVKLGEVLAFLPKALSIPGEKFAIGYSIRSLLKEVLVEPQGDNQLILDRISPQFLQGLFELEIPEVFEKLVEVKKVVRSAGYKAKVAVSSNDRNIDPVGTCVGIGGSRIKPILKELSGEKIDVFPWSDSLETLIKHALKPAIIDKVELSFDKKSALVFLDEDQRSFAIGKGGQNIALASQLTGVTIQLAKKENTAHRNDNEEEDIEREEEL